MKSGTFASFLITFCNPNYVMNFYICRCYCSIFKRQE
uniref:Uncharacterized protein n=1 Tax=Rhizophora mucronata TaxID=61149 RepID=A0A2P2PJS7_RHIMU